MDPQVLLIVRDEQGQVIRRVPGKREAGIHRVAWDLHYPSSEPISLRARPRAEEDEDDYGPSGPLALPGAYSVTLVKVVDGQETRLAGPVAFNVVPLELATFAAKDKPAVLAFHKKVARLERAVEGAIRVADDARERLNLIRRAIRETPAADPAPLGRADALALAVQNILADLRGDGVYSKFEEPAPPSIRGRVQSAAQWRLTSPPTQTQRDEYRHAAESFEKVLAALRTLVEQDLKALETQLESSGAPWTPGRVPVWTKEQE